MPIDDKTLDNLEPRKLQKDDVYQIDPRAAGTGSDFIQGGLLGVGQVPEYDKGVLISDVEDDPTYLNSVRADRQGGWEQFENAVVGGITKGLLTVPEIISYVTPGLGLGNTVKSLLGMEANEANAVAKFVKENKAELDKTFPIFREKPGEVIDLSDPGFYASALSSLIEFGVGFGVGGGIMGTAVKAVGTAAKTTRLAKILGEGVQHWTTAAINNLAEGRMISLDAFEKGVASDKVKIDTQLAKELEESAAKMRDFVGNYENITYVPDGVEGGGMKAVIKGTNLSPDEYYQQVMTSYAEGMVLKKQQLEKQSMKLRGGQMNNLQLLNTLMVASDFTQVKTLFSGADRLGQVRATSALENLLGAVTTKKGAASTLNLVGSSAAEEVYQEGITKETDYRIERELGVTKEKNPVDRFTDFITSDETILSGVLGGIGGPFQSFATTAVRDISGMFTGSNEERRKFNEELAKNQAMIKALVEQYVSAGFAKSAKDYEARVQAMKEGKEYLAATIQKESIADIAFRAMQSGTLNTLEEQVNEMAKKGVEEGEFTQDQADAVKEAYKEVPRFEQLYKDANKIAAYSFNDVKAYNESEKVKNGVVPALEVGAIDPLKQKLAYDLLVREDIAKKAAESIEATISKISGENPSLKHRSTRNSILNSHKKVTDAVAKAGKKKGVLERLLDGISTGLTPNQITKLKSAINSLGISRLEQAREVLSEEDFDRLSQIDDYELALPTANESGTKTVKLSFNEVLGLFDTVEDFTSFVYQKLKSGTSKGNRSKIKIKPNRKGPWDNEESISEELDELAQDKAGYEALTTLYGRTLESLRGKKDFSKESQAIIDELKLAALEGFTENTTDETEEEVVPEDIVTDAVYAPFTEAKARGQEAKVSDEILDKIADKSARGESLTGRESAVIVESADEFQRKVEDKLKANKQKSVDNVSKVFKDTTTEDKVQSIADALGSTSKAKAVREDLPRLRNEIDNDVVSPPEGISKEEFIAEIDDFIAKNIASVPVEQPKVSKAQILSVDPSSDDNWESEIDLESRSDDSRNGTFERKLSHPNAVAFTSNLDEGDSRNKKLVQFLENPVVKLEGYSVSYTIDPKAAQSREAKAAVEAFNKKRRKPDEDRLVGEYLPLRMYLIDAEGKPVMVDGEVLYGYVHDASHNYAIENETVRARVIDFFDNIRPRIIQALSEGKSVTSKIERQRAGYANHRYEWKWPKETEWRTRNTQDVTQEDTYRKARSKGKPQLKPVPNSLHAVLDGEPVVLAVGAEGGLLATFEDGKPVTIPQEVVRVENRIYFRIPGANGEYQYIPAYIRNRTTEEKALVKAIADGKSLDEINDTYPNEIDRVNQSVAGVATLEQISEFYKAPAKGDKIVVDMARLGDANYVKALSDGETPVLFTTLHKLDTNGRQGAERVFVQPTTVVSTSFQVDDVPMSSHNAIESLEVIKKVREAITAITDRLSKKTIGALGVLTGASSRDSVGKFIAGMKILSSNVTPDAQGNYYKAFYNVAKLFTTLKPEQIAMAAESYYYFSRLVAEEGYAEAKKVYEIPSGEGGLPASMMKTFDSMIAIQEEIFKNTALADEFERTIMGAAFSEDTSSNDSFTKEQKNDAARSIVKEEINNEVEEIKDPVTPESQTNDAERKDINEAVNNTDEVKAKVKQLKARQLPKLLKAVVSGKSNRALGKKKLAKAEALHTALMGVLPQLVKSDREFRDAVNEAIAQLNVEGVEDLLRLLESASDEAFIEFLSAYNPQLVADGGYEVKQEPVTNGDAPVIATKDDVIAEEKKRGAELEYTDNLEDATLSIDDLMAKEPTFVSRTLKYIRASLGGVKPIKITLPEEAATHQDAVNDMLALSPNSLEDWQRLSGIYEFMADKFPELMQEAYKQGFWDRFEYMDRTINSIFGTSKIFNKQVASIRNVLLSNIGKHYPLGAKDAALIKDINTYILDKFNTDESFADLHLVGALEAVGPAMMDMIMKYGKGKQGLDALEIGGKKVITIQKPDAFIIGYSDTRGIVEPVFRTYIKNNRSSVYKLIDVKDGKPVYERLEVKDYTADEMLYGESKSQGNNDLPVLDKTRTLVDGVEYKGYSEVDPMFTKEPIVEENSVVEISVAYMSGDKIVEIKSTSEGLKSRRKGTNAEWKTPTQNQLESYIEVMANRYKNKC